MQYALIDNQRIEALPKGRALCPICRTAVIAKCGSRRIHHWAHEGIKNCDSWKESETQWHRDWKNKFPADWREYIQHDDSGEKHIADVRTAHGLVLEFQHSSIHPNEREARERFHRNLWWVVDGTRLKRDYPRFQKAAYSFVRTNKPDFFIVPKPEKCLPVAWLNGAVSVFFDFLGLAPTNVDDQLRNALWQLIPGSKDGNVLIVAISRKRFVETVLNGPPRPQPAPADRVVTQNPTWRPMVRRHFRF